MVERILGKVRKLTREEAESLGTAAHDVMLKITIEGRHMGHERYIPCDMWEEYNRKGLKDKFNEHYSPDAVTRAIQKARAGFGPS